MRHIDWCFRKLRLIFLSKFKKQCVYYRSGYDRSRSQKLRFPCRTFTFLHFLMSASCSWVNNNFIKKICKIFKWLLQMKNDALRRCYNFSSLIIFHRDMIVFWKNRQKFWKKTVWSFNIVVLSLYYLPTINNVFISIFCPFKTLIKSIGNWISLKQ